MRMSLVLALCLLVGCGGVKEKPAVPSTAQTTTKVVGVDKKALRKLLRDCSVVQVPKDAKDKELQEVAVDLANARKASLEECNKRLRKARAQLDG